MWGKPTKKFWNKVPKLYATENIPAKDKLVYGHFFVGGADWYITEASQEEGMFFGYVNLGNPVCAEWGYFSLEELQDLRLGPMHVEWDKWWRIRKVSEVDNIR